MTTLQAKAEAAADATGAERGGLVWKWARDGAAHALHTLQQPEPITRPRISGDEFEALPENVRRYIYHLETETDPAGTIRSEMQLRDTVEALELRVKEMEEAGQWRPINEAVRGALMMEVVDCGHWSIRLDFGTGDEACRRMRALADAIRAFAASPE